MTMATDPFRLTEAEQIALRDAADDVRQLNAAIDRFEAAGFDVSDLRARLALAAQRRDGLLKHFGNPVVPK